MAGATIKNEELTWPWRGSHATLLGELLSSGFKSDFTLILGPNKEKVAVHKVFLQFVSTVLNSRVKKCSSTQLDINDVDPVIFKLLLKYIYTGNSGMTILEALPLLKMATVFEIFPLVDQCAALLKTDITLENVLPLFQGAMEYAHGELIQSTMAFICKNGQKVLKLDDFVNLRLECLIEIIQQDGLQILDEIDVFNAVYRWGEAEQVRAQEPVEIKSVLTKALTHVRFKLMDQKKFTLDVVTKNVLDMSELTSILTGFYAAPEQKINGRFPQSSFPSSPRARPLPTHLTLSRSPGCRYTSAIGTSLWLGECLLIVSDARVALKGFIIPDALFHNLIAQSYTYFTDKLRVDFSLKCGNQTKSYCLPLGNLVDERYQININPPFESTSARQPTYFTANITGMVDCQLHRGGRVDQASIGSSRTLISNFGCFVESPTINGIRLVIQRKHGDYMPMTQGFVESLIFAII